MPRKLPYNGRLCEPADARERPRRRRRSSTACAASGLRGPGRRLVPGRPQVARGAGGRRRAGGGGQRRRGRARLDQGPLRDAHAARRTCCAGLALAARGGGRARGHRLPEGRPSTRPAAALERRAAPTRRRRAWTCRIRRGDDSYIAGEETALLEVARGPARLAAAQAAAARGGRLPGPADARPERGDAGPRAGGGRRSRRLSARRRRRSSRCGATCARPGVYEVPLGTPLRARDRRAGRRRAGRHRHASSPPAPRRAPLRRRRSSTRRSIPTRCAPRARRWARRRSWSSARPPARWRWRPRWPRSSSASPAASARRARVGSAQPRARAARGGERATARARDLQRPGRGRPASWPTTATARTAARRRPSVTGLLRARSRDDVAAHLAARALPAPEAPPCDPFAPGSPERARHRGRARA